MNDYLGALLGGALIGLASVCMLLFNGKILGVSGIIGGLLPGGSKDTSWRYSFLFGLLFGGIVLRILLPSAFSFTLHRSVPALIVAGLLVGFGTRLGNGCTSGHGVCGVGRLSPRSLVATVTFILTGALTVFCIQHLFGGQI